MVCAKLSCLAFQAGHGQEPFASKLDYLNQLSPHLSRVFKIHKLLGINEKGNTIKGWAENQTDATIICSDGAQILYLNEQAQQLFTQSKLLSVGNNQLILPLCYRQQFDATVYQSVKNAEGNINRETQEWMVIHNQDAKPLYIFHFIPLNGLYSNVALQYKQAVVAVKIYSMQSEIQLNSHLMQQLYELTTAELSIIQELINGYTLKAIAQKWTQSSRQNFSASPDSCLRLVALRSLAGSMPSSSFIRALSRSVRAALSDISG